MTETTAKAHRTVSRVTDILEFVAQQQGARMHELAAALGAPRSSVYELVNGLVSTRYLIDDKGTYRLGPALGNLLLQPLPDLASAARPSLEALRDELDETAILGIGVGDSLVYVESAESDQLVRYSAPIRIRRPLYPTTAGKVILAFRSVRQREAYLRSVITEPERLEAAREELAVVRVAGVAFNRGEMLPEVTAVARPILVGGELCGVIAVAGPTTRITDRLPEIAEALSEAAAAAAERLGFPDASKT